MVVATQNQKMLFVLVAIVTAVYSIFAAVLMTEPGQSLNLPRSWVVTYYQYRWLFIGLNVALLLYLWYLHLTLRIWTKFWMGLATTGVFVCIIAANFLLTAFFPSYQYGANYVSITEADSILDDDDVIYAVEINGDARGYPRKHLEVPHIAGDNIGGKDVVMTFCALSNLPVVIEQDIGFGKSDLGILIQTHNNLVMVDRQSGELIQQITRQKEFSANEIVSHPNTMTTWRSFKELYPEAKVFIYEFNRVVDSLLLALFEGPMERQFSNEHGPIFPTLAMSDNRLLPKEQVWGFDAGNVQVAFTRTFAQDNPLFQFSIEGQSLVLVYDEKHDIVNLFDGVADGQLVDFESVDFRGMTENGQLVQLPMHNGVFWMVWSHWYPDTLVYGGAAGTDTSNAGGAISSQAF